MQNRNLAIYIFFSAFLFFFLPGIQAQDLVLTKISGDHQQQSSGTLLSEPITVRASDLQGNPLQGIKVEFTPLTSPASSALPEPSVKACYTDSLGFATTNISLGEKPGEYTLMAEVRFNGDSEYVIFRFTALKKNWVNMRAIRAAMLFRS